MKLQIHFFGIASEKAGISSDLIELSGSTLQDLRKLLCEQYPNLASMVQEERVAIWINNNPVKCDYVFQDNDDVAIVPPFAGG